MDKYVCVCVCVRDYECGHKIMMTGADNIQKHAKQTTWQRLTLCKYTNICYTQYQIVSTINRKKKNYTTPLPCKRELIVNRKQHEWEKSALCHRGRECAQRLTITCLCAQQVSFIRGDSDSVPTARFKYSNCLLS